MKLLSLPRLVLAVPILMSSWAMARCAHGQVIPGAFPAAFSARLIPDTAKPGEVVKLELAVELDPGYHTYDLEQPEIPAVASQITLESTDPLEPLGDWTGTLPEEKLDEVLKKRIYVHYGSPTWVREFRVPADAAGELKLAGKMRFTVCDERGCLPPKTERFQVVLRIAAAGADSAAASVPREVGAGPGAEAPAAAAESASSEARKLLAEFFGELKVIHVDTQVQSLWMALGFGFLAGLILNVMPCVLPVISLKIYGFVKQAGQDRTQIRLLGLSFGAGILVVFLVLAGAAAFFGLAWGQLFQKPGFVVGMIAAMVVFALGMFDVYVINLPGFVSNAESATAQKEGLLGSFLKGMLATLLATPCSGPFLGATLAYALTQPPPVIFAIYAAMGLGMAFPYVLLAMFPAWMKILPRPGDWMTSFKELMGFLMLGTAVWLLWQRRTNGEFVVWTVAFTIFVSLGMWWYGRWSTPLSSTVKRLLAPVAALSVMVAGGYFSFGVMYDKAAAVVDKSDAWPAFDLDRLLTARAAGKTVVVDWTADW